VWRRVADHRIERRALGPKLHVRVRTRTFEEAQAARAAARPRRTIQNDFGEVIEVVE
jgi:hypothetical protein